jgi:membrane-bound serine protease (ClpP class)
MVYWLIILLVIAVVMFVAELFVPSGGLLAIIGAASLTAAIVICFSIDRWLGVGVTVASILIAPFIMAGSINLWQRSPLGKRMIITQTVGQLPKPEVLIGSSGIALTEMRPMGEVEIGELRVEAQSEMGIIIPAGAKVKVLAMSGGIATVRQVKETANV